MQFRDDARCGMFARMCNRGCSGEVLCSSAMQLGIGRPSSHFFSSCLDTLPSWFRSSMCSRSETRRCCSNHDSPCVSRRWSVGTPMRTVRQCLRVKLLREALHRFADRRLVEYIEPIPHATLAWTLLHSNRRSRLSKIRSVSCVPSAGRVNR